MILVTGAAGKTGRAVIQALNGKGAKIRALVHRSHQIPVVEALGAGETVVGDMEVKARVDQALRGVRSVYHICPNVHQDEILIGQAVIKGARSVGVAHFVYHSVLHPQTEFMPHHWKKLRVEEMLFESGLPYTIIQPAAYMQNILAHWEKITEEGIYPVPYSVETRLSLIDLRDVTQVIARVLTEPGHTGATYELVGTKAFSQLEVAEILSEKLGRLVRAHTVPLDVWERQARAADLGDYQVETLIKMFKYYERYGFWGNIHVLSWLLDRPPTSLETFIEHISQERFLQSNRSKEAKPK